MKILIASNGHKGFASSVQIGEWIAQGIRESSPKNSIRVIPVADGGEGTIDALLYAKQGDRMTVTVHDPYFRERKAEIAFFDDGTKSAVIEIAQACGSSLVAPEERDTMRATSYGVGELIRACLDRDSKKIIVGLGGCIASDGGMGMAQALGVHFYDDNGRKIDPAGNKGFNVRSLRLVDRVNLENLDPRLSKTKIVVASDVTIPLLGPHGQARTFGPQKGAGSKEIEEIESGLTHWNKVLQKTFGRDFNVDYAGAAGGLGAGLAAFANGRLEGGGDFILEEIGFEKELDWADVVITGEGKLDATTLLGKSPFAIAQEARKKAKPVLAAVLQIENGLREDDFGFDRLFLIGNRTDSYSKEDEALPQSCLTCGRQIAGFLSAS